MPTRTETVQQQFTTSDSPRIVVESFNGAVDVKAGSPGEVAVTVVRRGSAFTGGAAASALGSVEVRITHEDDTIRVRAWRAHSQPLLSSCGASVEVTAPAGSILDLATSNGRVYSSGITGPVSARSSNGAIDLDGVAAPTVVQTGNGSVTVRAAGPAVVHAANSNGSVEFFGALAPGESVFTTSNGSIQLVLPPDAQFALVASTSNGKIQNEFGMASGTQSATHVVGSVGDRAGVTIRAETSNGKITVRRP